MLKAKYIDNPHSYQIGGKTVPSVTQILGSKGGGRASAQGSIFHNYMLEYNSTNDYEKTLQTLKEHQPENISLFENYVTLRKVKKIFPIASEFIVAGRVKGLMYAGTVDVLAIQLVDENRYALHIIDYKTGANKTGDLRQKYRYQLTLYAQALSYAIKTSKGFVSDLANELEEHNPVVAKILRDRILVDGATHNVQCHIVYRKEVDSFYPSKDDIAHCEKLVLAYCGNLEGYSYRGGKIYAITPTISKHTKDLALALEKKKTLEDKISNSNDGKELKKLDEYIEELKNTITPSLTQEGHKDNSMFIYYINPRKTIKLKEDIQKNLLENNPEYFDIKEGKGYFVFKSIDKEEKNHE